MKTRNGSILIIIFFLMVLPAVIGFLCRQLEIKTAQASEVPQLKKQVSKLEIEVKVATASSEVVRLTEDQIGKMLEILMPKKADREQFMRILKCENGSHDPKRVNVNKAGLGYDLGIAQINSRFHSNRVKEFFGQDFDEAMQDPVKNLVYATYLYQHSGFGPWVCNKKVANGEG